MILLVKCTVLFFINKRQTMSIANELFILKSEIHFKWPSVR